MPRRARVSLPNIPHHIVQRGNNRQACFFKDTDRQLYLEWLAEYAEHNQCKVHAYVLMSNHVHLLATPEVGGAIGQMMKQLGQRYVQYINRTYQRSGTLWEGRYKSCLTLEEDYLMVCYRYIELNPVRAGMVELPEHYPWSSYRANGLGEASDLISVHEVYQRLGMLANERREAYRELFAQQLPSRIVDEIRDATNGNYVLGTAEFRNQVEQLLGRRAGPGVPGRPRLIRAED